MLFCRQSASKQGPIQEMSDNQTSCDGDDKGLVAEHQQLVENEIHLASAFVTPFAAAVAAELEEFGLSKHKIDELMLRSAKRFGAMSEEIPNTYSPRATDSAEKTGAYFEWVKWASVQARDLVASLVTKHGHFVVEMLAPIVRAALEDAISNAVKNATGGRGGSRRSQKRKPQGRGSNSG